MDEKIILNGFSGSGMGALTEFIWLRIGCCECGNEPSGSIKCGKILH
jgi:hypothetical protein